MVKLGNKTGKKYYIGIFGGTFNPIHNVHLKMARLAQKKLGLNRVIFVPAARPPHKRVAGQVTPQERYRMTCLAIKPYSRFYPSARELRHSGQSYSVETVESFKKRFGQKAELFFIIGSDSLSELFTWKKINKLLRLCKFVVFRRSQYPIKLKKKILKERVEIVNMPPQRISSTEIRQRIKEGQDVSRFVPQAVLEFIQKRKLYR